MANTVRITIPSYTREDGSSEKSQGNITLEDVSFVIGDTIRRYARAVEGCNLKEECDHQYRQFSKISGESVNEDVEQAKYALFQALFVDKHITPIPNKDQFTRDKVNGYENPEVRRDSTKNLLFTYPDLKDFAKQYLEKAFEIAGEDKSQSATIAYNMQAFVDEAILRTPLNLATHLDDAFEKSSKSGLIRQALESLPKTPLAQSNTPEGNINGAMVYMVGARVLNNPKLIDDADTLMTLTLNENYRRDNPALSELKKQAEKIAASVRQR